MLHREPRGPARPCLSLHSNNLPQHFLASASAGPSAAPPTASPAGPTSQSTHVHQPIPKQDPVSPLASPSSPLSSASGTRRRAAPDGSEDEAASGRTTKRLRIIRTCDQCRPKNKHPGCSGFKPCFPCIPTFRPALVIPTRLICPYSGTRKGITCTYDAPYTRGVARTPPPPPEGDNGEARN